MAAGVGGLVYQGRKAAGEAFVEARNIAYGPERTEAIEAV